MTKIQLSMYLFISLREEAEGYGNILFLNIFFLILTIV